MSIENEELAAIMDPEITVRPFRTIDEMKACVLLQRAIWGYADVELAPIQIFLVASRTGGQVFGAFRHDQPIGFTIAFAGFRDGHDYIHSHMTGVLPEYHNRGVARQLKLLQRENALARGIDLIEWSFDPLQAKNAHFNFTRLGAIAREYVPDLYGRSSSPLHRGLPTDRLIVQWWIREPRVEQVLKCKEFKPSADAQRIRIPCGALEGRTSTLRVAAETQLRLRHDFASLFQRSYAVTGFELNETDGIYLLEYYPR